MIFWSCLSPFIFHSNVFTCFESAWGHKCDRNLRSRLWKELLSTTPSFPPGYIITPLLYTFGLTLDVTGWIEEDKSVQFSWSKLWLFRKTCSWRYVTEEKNTQLHTVRSQFWNNNELRTKHVIHALKKLEENPWNINTSYLLVVGLWIIFIYLKYFFSTYV